MADCTWRHRAKTPEQRQGGFQGGVRCRVCSTWGCRTRTRSRSSRLTIRASSANRAKPPPPITAAPPARTTRAAPTAPPALASPSGVPCTGRPRCRRRRRPLPSFWRPRQGRASPQHLTAAPRAAALSASPRRLPRRRPPRRWWLRPSPGSAATTAGRSAKRPRSSSSRCARPYGTIPDTLPGLHDRALLLVGFAAALRPSELAQLDIAALTRHEDGIALFLSWRWHRPRPRRRLCTTSHPAISPSRR